MRDAWLDNVKMALVTVVVIGHSVVLAPSDNRNDHIYDFIYAWHIPAFVLVTGYLSRSFRWSRRHLTALVTTIAVPYVIFEIAMYELLRRVAEQAGDQDAVEMADKILVNERQAAEKLAASYDLALERALHGAQKA